MPARLKEKEVVTEDRIADIAHDAARNEIDKSNNNNKSDVMKDKINKLRERIALSDKEPSKMNTCPGCKGHDLHIHDGIAKCSGPNCGKEFLLLEKESDVRNKYMCTNCGHTIDENTANKLNESKELCPLCKKGDKMIDIDWNIIDKRLKL